MIAIDNLQQIMERLPALKEKLKTYEESKQEQFYRDFGTYSQTTAETVLEELAANLDVVEIWAQCSDGVKESRIKLAFLQKYQDLKSLKDGLMKHCRGIRRASNGNTVGGHTVSSEIFIKLIDNNGVERQINDINPDTKGVRKLPEDWNLEIGDYLKNSDHSIKQPPKLDWRKKAIDPVHGHTFFPLNMNEEEIFEQFVSAVVNPQRSIWTRTDWAAAPVARSESGIYIRWWEMNGYPTSYFPEYTNQELEDEINL